MSEVRELAREISRVSSLVWQLVLVAVLAALYIAYGYVSSVFFRQFTRSLDLFFLIAVMFAILAVLVQRPGASTLFGVVTGLVFFGTPAPAAQHIAASLTANGIVFDLYLKATNGFNSISRTHILIAAALGNLAMAIVGLLALQASGLKLPAAVWGIAIVGDPLVGIAGALFGLSVSRRIRPTSTVSLKC